MVGNEPVFRSDLLFDELTDGVCIADKRGDILYMNPAAKRMILDGEPPRDALPNACRLLCGKLFAAGSDDFAAHCPLLAAGAHQSVVEFQGRHGPHAAVRWDGDRVERADRWRHLRVRCLRVTSSLWTLGVEERHFILIQDASASVELAQKKEDWRRMVAHDIRSPLTNVLGTLLLLDERKPDEPLAADERELVRSSVNACRRMVELLNLFLDLAELDEGMMPVKVSKVRLRPLIRRALDELSSRAAEKGLVVEESGCELEASADETLLARVAQNVLDNAVKFSPRGGRVAVTARRLADGGVALSVRDEGPGIDPKDLPFIFDRYFQAQARREGRTQGNGLGLAFCRQALSAMGGEIEARSRPGEGSEFIVRLPAPPAGGAP